MDAFWWGAQATLGAVCALVGLWAAVQGVSFAWFFFFSQDAKDHATQEARWAAEERARAERRAAKGLGAPPDGHFFCRDCDAVRKRGDQVSPCAACGGR